MDWSTTILLAAVLWAEGGLKQVPAGSLVLQRVLAGHWRVARVARLPCWIVLAAWPASVVSLVITQPRAVTLSGDEIAARLRRVKWPVRLLRLLGGLTALLLVVGFPVGAARHGGFGVLVVVAVLLPVVVATATVSAMTAKALEMRSAAALKFAVPVLSPFTAAYAANRVLAVAMLGSSPIFVARQLMGETDFAHWAGPHLYDALTRPAAGTSEQSLEQERRTVFEGFDFQLTTDELRAALAIRDLGLETDTAYCPRCAATYRPSMTHCEDCGRLELAQVR